MVIATNLLSSIQEPRLVLRNTAKKRHDDDGNRSYVHIYTGHTKMSRPTTRLCADCLPTALRPKGAGGPVLLPATPPPRRGTPRRAQIKGQRRGLHYVPGCRPVSHATGYHVRASGGVKTLAGPCEHVRRFATVGGGENQDSDKGAQGVPQDGPLKEYENRIMQGRLRNDPYQRRMCLWSIVRYAVVSGR